VLEIEFSLTAVLAAWLTADLVSGVAHWAEDRYGDPQWTGWVGRHIVQPNILHHTHPRDMLIGGYLTRNWTTILPTAVAAGVLAALGQYWWASVFVVASQANEIHGWTHQRCNRFVRGLQAFGVLCSPEHHSQHHSRPFDTHYCVITDWVNPTLNSVGFWGFLEGLVYSVTGLLPCGERE